MLRRWREEFIAAYTRMGGNSESARYVLRNAATVLRLNEAECNGDWPCDNGERKTVCCAQCQTGYVKSSLNKVGVCPNCRAADRIRAHVKDLLPGAVVTIHGDPRGWTVEIKRPAHLAAFGPCKDDGSIMVAGW